MRISKILLFIGIFVLILALFVTIGIVVLSVNNTVTDDSFINVLLYYAVGITFVIISRVVKK